MNIFNILMNYSTFIFYYDIMDDWKIMMSQIIVYDCIELGDDETFIIFSKKDQQTAYESLTITFNSILSFNLEKLSDDKDYMEVVIKGDTTLTFILKK